METIENHYLINVEIAFSYLMDPFQMSGSASHTLLRASAL